MKTNFIYELLIDPVTRESLKPDENGLKVVSESGKSSYEIIEGVPQIVTGSINLTDSPELYKSQHSDFHYLEHYQADAELFDYSEGNESTATKHEIRRLHESILKEINKGSSLILDAGCGNGWAAADLVRKGHRIISMDVSTKNPIESIHRTVHPDHAGLTADVYSLPFGENTFDYIIASEIMEHVPDPKLFIQCLLEVLKCDGKLIITTPYNEKIEYCLCIHCNRVTPRHAHLYSFNKDNMVKYLPKTDISYKITIFSNKYLAKIRAHLVLKFFSFWIWRPTDIFFNRLFGGALRLKLTITKY